MKEQEVTKEHKIKEMPDQQLLEDYLRGGYGPVGVIFNKQLGIFERTVVREEWLKRIVEQEKPACITSRS